ncbi:DUF3833 family protein [Zavarzinia sp. CC-PAN008]|uniref:DUF3833 family protein n=1 Tax=Zavarzinia sp. CC-PAN008 TaxID=3243332 RepID=UPI003F745028
MRFLGRILCLLALPILWVLAANLLTPPLDQQARLEPALRPEEYFVGTVVGFGVVTDPFGIVREEFRQDVAGRIENGLLVMDERFTYRSGARDQRIWTIRFTPDGLYQGTAADVPAGGAGRAVGNALAWRFALPLDTGLFLSSLDLDQVMLRQDAETVINQVRISKFGIPLGQISIVFRKQG